MYLSSNINKGNSLSTSVLENEKNAFNRALFGKKIKWEE